MKTRGPLQSLEWPATVTSDKRTIFVAVHESANGPNSDLSSCLLDDRYVDAKQAARHPCAIININATKLTQRFKYECGFDGGRYVKLATSRRGTWLGFSYAS